MKPKAHIGLLMWDRRVPSQRQRGFSFIFFYTAEKEAHYSKKHNINNNKKKQQQNIFLLGRES